MKSSDYIKEKKTREGDTQDIFCKKLHYILLER
jgi:hypothetical protein